MREGGGPRGRAMALPRACWLLSAQANPTNSGLAAPTPGAWCRKRGFAEACESRTLRVTSQCARVGAHGGGRWPSPVHAGYSPHRRILRIVVSRPLRPAPGVVSEALPKRVSPALCESRRNARGWGPTGEGDGPPPARWLLPLDGAGRLACDV